MFAGLIAVQRISHLDKVSIKMMSLLRKWFVCLQRRGVKEIDGGESASEIERERSRGDE